jgi:hypothetical protein
MSFTKKDQQELALWELTRKELMETDRMIWDKISKLQSKKKAVELGVFLGKCYKFYDSYSEDKQWFVYVKFTGIDEEYGELVGQRFCKDSLGEIEFQANKRISYVVDYIKNGKAFKITPRHFDIMKEKYLREGGFI